MEVKYPERMMKKKFYIVSKMAHNKTKSKHQTRTRESARQRRNQKKKTTREKHSVEA